MSQRNDGGYDLCGQDRIEAFLALGQTEIPAVVLQIPKEDGFVLSLGPCCPTYENVKGRLL